MRAPSVDGLDELVQVIENLTVIISHLTYDMFQEAKKDNPHLKSTTPQSKKKPVATPKIVATEKTLEMTEQIMGLQNLLNDLLDRLKTTLRMADIHAIEKAQQYHERLRPGTAHDPISRDIVAKLDAIYKEVKEERGNDKTVYA